MPAFSERLSDRSSELSDRAGGVPPDEPFPSGSPADLPATWRPAERHAFLTTDAGIRLRYGVWQDTGPRRGTILLLGGRAEFLEKYAMEVSGELLQRGFDIVSMDWRGQGLSSRVLADRQKGHIDNLDTYVRDLALLLAHLPDLKLPGPLLAVAHSMGGHTVMRHLAESGARTPLAGALVTAPMTGLRREAAIRSVLMLMPQRPIIEERYFLYGSGPFRTIGREFFGNRVTHDERRFRFTEQWFAAEPRLAVGGPTIGWLRQSLRSMRRMQMPGYLEAIDVPLTILSAGQDLLVDSATHPSIAARIARAECITYADSGHEIMMETDPIRARFLVDLDRFIERTLAGTAARQS